MIKNIPFRVNEQSVRGVALVVFIISIVTILTGSPAGLIFLAGDFFIRAFLTPALSPLALFSKAVVVPVTKFKYRIITFKPKRFAAGIGFFMSILGSLLLLSGYSLWGTTVVSILALFSFLEAVFSFCAGCKIFGLLIKIGLLKEESCTDCSVAVNS